MLSTGIEPTPARTMLPIVLATFVMLAPKCHIATSLGQNLGFPYNILTHFHPGIILPTRRGGFNELVFEVPIDHGAMYSSFFGSAVSFFGEEYHVLQFGTLALTPGSMTIDVNTTHVTDSLDHGCGGGLPSSIPAKISLCSSTYASDSLPAHVCDYTCMVPSAPCTTGAQPSSTEKTDSRIDLGAFAGGSVEARTDGARLQHNLRQGFRGLERDGILAHTHGSMVLEAAQMGGERHMDAFAAGHFLRFDWVHCGFWFCTLVLGLRPRVFASLFFCVCIWVFSFVHRITFSLLHKLVAWALMYELRHVRRMVRTAEDADSWGFERQLPSAARLVRFCLRFCTLGQLRILCLFSVLSFLPVASAVCDVCGGFFAGCVGEGGKCKGVEGVASNVKALVAASGVALTLAGLFQPYVTRVFTSSVLAILKTYASMPVAGTAFDFTDKDGAQIVEAVLTGKLSKIEATLHFTRQIEKAGELEDAGETKKRLAVLDSQSKLLDRCEDRGAASTSAAPMWGVHHFIWGKCSEVVMGKNSTVSISGSSSDKISKSEITSKIYVPDTEAQFFETVHLWIAIMVHVGIAPHMLVFDLAQTAVYDAIRLRRENWMLAHETLLEYLQKIDQSPDRSITLQNVRNNPAVGVDTVRQTAISNAEARFGKRFTDIFRPSGGTRTKPGEGWANDSKDKELKVYNEKFTKSSKLPCEAWNRGNDHRQNHLHEDGTCKFRHGCSQWIKLADGTVGYCMRNHRKDECDRDTAERSAVGPAKPTKP